MARRVVPVNGWTPTEERMMAKLRDGQPHLKSELVECLWDELGNGKTVEYHLSKMRKKLRLEGHDILTQFIKRKLHIRLVRLITDEE